MRPTDVLAPDYFHKVVDCQWACPAHTPVPEYIRLISGGRDSDAYLRAAIAWHFGADTGSPYWLRTAKDLDFNPLTDVTAFTEGRDLAIVELNGVTAESTNIYDPRRTLLGAYRTLYAQWVLVFSIGAANLRHGTAPVPLRRLASLAWAHLTDRRAFPVSS